MYLLIVGIASWGLFAGRRRAVFPQTASIGPAESLHDQGDFFSCGRRLHVAAAYRIFLLRKSLVVSGKLRLYPFLH